MIGKSWRRWARPLAGQFADDGARLSLKVNDANAMCASFDP
jgi:hypothetical protein